MKNISNERFMKKLERVTEMQDMVAKGEISISEIARHFGIKWQTAKSELQLGNIIFNYQLSPENVAKRRKKVNNKLISIGEEARNQYIEMINAGAYREAVSFFKIYADIWSQYIPNVWGLLNGSSDSKYISPINVDSVNFNKIDMTVTKEDVQEAEDKIYDIADRAGVKIR